MQCEVLADLHWIEQYAADHMNLNDSERKTVKDHLAECKPCMRKYEALLHAKPVPPWCSHDKI